MRTNITGGVLAVLAVVVLFVAYLSLFTVYQTRQALVVRLGDPVKIVTEPGLHAKLPLIDTVIYVDNRILDLENSSQEVICSDQKRLVVDAFARYRRQRGAKSSAVAADTMSSASPSFSPAALTDCKPGTCEGVLGFQSTPTRVACGTT